MDVGEPKSVRQEIDHTNVLNMKINVPKQCDAVFFEEQRCRTLFVKKYSVSRCQLALPDRSFHNIGHHDINGVVGWWCGNTHNMHHPHTILPHNVCDRSHHWWVLMW